MYFCDLCSKPFFHKGDFKKHLFKVKKCGIETDTNNIALIMDKYNIVENDSKNDENDHQKWSRKNHQNCIAKKPPKMEPRTPKISRAKNNLECEYCFKVFCRVRCYKNKHISSNCKKKERI